MIHLVRVCREKIFIMSFSILLIFVYKTDFPVACPGLLTCCVVLIQVQDVDRQNKLQQARLLRTPQEPKECEQSTSVEIKVRHVSLGIVTRNFRDSECMACVYDWVGSLSLIPEHFQLLDYTGMMLLPSQVVKEAAHTTLNMTETMSTPPLEDHEEVTFLGFGINDWNPIADADSLLEPIWETPPEQFLDCDERYMYFVSFQYNNYNLNLKCYYNEKCCSCSFYSGSKSIF